MNKREDALIEALQKNAEETERWKAFLKENETAKENLSIFQKRLNVEVMVPMGKKALIPGHLIHTNEVLVGHYQGYFSKCSAFKASEICDLRIRTAKEHLEKLEKELELWQNKLEKPYTEGMMASGEQQEIIEDYNEEQEKLWREQHKIRLKEAKQKEKQKRDIALSKLAKEKKTAKQPTAEKSDEEIIKMLEDAELMEELENELDNLEIDEVTDDTLRKLIAGDMKLPVEKKRVAHDDKERKLRDTELESSLATQIVKKTTLHNDRVPATNNNVISNPELSSENNANNSDDESASEDDSLPEEVKIIKEQAKFLSKEDQIGFYEYQIEIIRQKVASLPQRSLEQIDEKIHLFDVLEHLEELLEIVETLLGNEELAEQEENEESPDETIENENESKKEYQKMIEIDIPPKKVNQKRRISFALEDETLEFCKTDTVIQMMLDKPIKRQRDVITLDDNKLQESKEDLPLPATIDKKQLIQSKVEQNLLFICENQSEHDFDMVNKILENSQGNICTLHIPFKHSRQIATETTDNDNQNCDLLGSPDDIYLKYLELTKSTEPATLFINSYEGEDKVKAPALKEIDKQQAFEDPKAKFSNPKSILRNKVAIEKENHYPRAKTTESIEKKQKKRRTPQEEEESLSAYNKVMHDVVEKVINEPEPLPECKFIDSHTPKKRVSRFKQMRQGTEKT